MTIVDEETLLNRARMALDASGIGQAILDGDMEEARFLTHFLRTTAADLGFEATARAASEVMAHLPQNARLPLRGIGRALLTLTDTLAFNS